MVKVLSTVDTEEQLIIFIQSTVSMNVHQLKSYMITSEICHIKSPGTWGRNVNNIALRLFVYRLLVPVKQDIRPPIVIEQNLLLSLTIPQAYMQSYSFIRGYLLFNRMSAP